MHFRFPICCLASIVSLTAPLLLAAPLSSANDLSCDSVCPFLVDTPSLDLETLGVSSLIDVMCKPDDRECRRSIYIEVRQDVQSDLSKKFKCDCSIHKKLPQGSHSPPPYGEPEEDSKWEVRPEPERPFRPIPWIKNPANLAGIILGVLVGVFLLLVVGLALGRRYRRSKKN